MKHLFIFIAAVGLCLCCTSCANDDDEIRAKAKGESIYLQLTLSDGMPVTRTSGDTIADETTERKVSDLSVFLLKAGSTQTPDVTGTTSPFLQFGSVRINQNNQTDLIEIPAEKQGTYKLYVLTNTGLNSSFSPILTSEQTFIGQYGTYGYSAAKNFWAPNQFFMSNRQNAVNGVASVEVNLTGHHPMEDPVRVEVNMERMALKVVVTEATNIDVKPVGTNVYGTDKNYKLSSMTVDGVCLMNCATKFNLIQQWKNATKASDYSTATPKGYPELLLVSPSSDKNYSIETGYYNRWADLVNPTTKLINSSTEFVEPGKPMFCFENNSPYYTDLLATETSQSSMAVCAAGKTKMKGRVTAVAIRVRCELEGGGYSTDDLPLDPNVGSWTRAGGSGGQTFYQYNDVFYADIAKLLAVNTGLTSISTTSTVSQLRNAGVKVFENGYMYYVHWIKDQNYQDDGEHYYSVMRNTYYGLEVQQINGFGEDIPGGDDYNPYDPIDVEDISLILTTTVRPWTKYDIDVTLK